MDKLTVAAHLTDVEYDNFFKTYTDHIRTMGVKRRDSFNLGKIIKIERNFEDRCFNVHFDNGDWWKYYLDGTWG